MSVRIFPIRHHSPASALLVERAIAADPPRRLLLEGPSDGDALLPSLLDPGTKPPVAILAWRAEGATALYPFARYSPEYAALRCAARLGIPVRFIDIPASRALDRPEREGVDADLEGEICARLGFRSYDEFWEGSFESGSLDPDEFARLFLDYARLMRREPGRATSLDREREAFMAREIGREPAEGTFVVCGAFHAAALLDGEIESFEFPACAPAKLALIPYSYLRLSERFGYGAGNRAPRFYERLYEQGGDPFRAADASLLDIRARLRRRGWTSGIAEVLDACRLSRNLAKLRGKASPGLDEVREAASACLLEGSDSDVLRESLLGETAGSVAARLSASPLEEEFYSEVRRYGLPIADRPKEAIVGDASPFLHRLRLAEIPYATLLVEGRREKWRLAWAPATDASLLRKTEIGTSLAEVARRRILDRLPNLRSASDAAEALRDTIFSKVDAMRPALDRFEELATRDRDLRSLAGAASRLKTTVELGAGELSDLYRRVSSRAFGIAPECAQAADVSAALLALSALAESGFDAPALRIARDERAHPASSGAALALLGSRRALSKEEMLAHLHLRLSRAKDAAAFVGGFVSVQPRIVGRDRELLAVLDRYFDSISMDRFLELLPIFRRAFAGLGAPEVLRLLESVRSLNASAERPTVDRILEEWKGFFDP